MTATDPGTEASTTYVSVDVAGIDKATEIDEDGCTDLIVEFEDGVILTLWLFDPLAIEIRQALAAKGREEQGE